MRERGDNQDRLLHDAAERRNSRSYRRTLVEVAQCADGSFAPFMLPSFAQQYGCPRALPTGHDPWPDVTEIERGKAAAVGGRLGPVVA